MRKYKKFEELNVLDNFLFNELAMQKDKEKSKQFFRILLETILQKKIGDLELIPQKIMQGRKTDRHGIQMDTYVEAYVPEDDETDIIMALQPQIFDIEPNLYATDSEERRTRYYHSLIDTKLFEAGKKYSDLKNVTLIMISDYDPFGRNRMVYTIGKHFAEEPDIPYHDGAKTIFLYTYGSIGKPETGLADLLKYMADSRNENVVNGDILAIQDMVREIKSDADKGVRYMKSWEIEDILFEQGLKEGINHGINQGVNQGIATAILDLLGDLGTIPDALKTRIESQDNREILRKWNKIAANARSIDEFLQNIG